MEKPKILFVLSKKEPPPRIVRLTDLLEKMGVSTGVLDGDITASIAKARIVVFFLSEQSANDDVFREEARSAYECAIGRDKIVIPIVEWDGYTDVKGFEYLLSGRETICPEDGLHSQQDFIDTAGIIYDKLIGSEQADLLYEKVRNLSRIGYIPGVSSCLSDLIILLCNKIKRCESASTRRDTYKELLRCMEQLQTCRESGFTDADMKQAEKRHDALKHARSLLDGNDFKGEDLYLISFAIRMLYIEYHIWSDIAYTSSYGDVGSCSEDYLRERFYAPQDLYLKKYHYLIVSERISDFNHGKYTEDEISLILSAKDCLISGAPQRPVSREVIPGGGLSDTETQLHAIADYIRQSNKLFDLIGSGGLSAAFLKCLKTSYERLRNYSELVGCLDICAECIERIAEINQLLEQLEDESTDDSLAESGIKALLGFTLPGSEGFDVFMSYKHEDSDIVKSIYHFLKRNAIYPFFDMISLPELSKSEYEDAIMEALDRSKHFIVILSDLDYLNSYWVELEMKTFRHEIVEGRKTDSNFLLIVTDNVFQEIRRTNKQCLPIKYRSYEIIRVKDYRNSILPYLK